MNRSRYGPDRAESYRREGATWPRKPNPTPPGRNHQTPKDLKASHDARKEQP